MEQQWALDTSRAFSDSVEMKIERGYGAQVRQQLADKEHNVSVPIAPFSGAQAILIGDNSVLEGVSDPRNDGYAIGY